MSKYLNYLKYVILAVGISMSLYYLCSYANSVKLEPGIPKTIWVRSQNGNDDTARLNVGSADAGHSELKYTVEKYAQIGIVSLPDVNTLFSSIHDGRKIPEIRTADAFGGLTIIDHNKICDIDGLIKSWEVVSRNDENEVRIAVFKHSASTNKYTLVKRSVPRIAKKGLNTFYEESPISIRQNEVLALLVMKPIAANKVFYNEMAEVVTYPGFPKSFDKPVASIEMSRGSFSYSARIYIGSESGKISNPIKNPISIKLPPVVVYDHLSWYKFTFISDAGAFSLLPSMAAMLLNANPFIGLAAGVGNPWTPAAFSWIPTILMLLLFTSVSSLLFVKAQERYPLVIATAGLLALFALARYLGHSFPGAQFVAIFAAFIMVLLLPGRILARYYPTYASESVPGRIVLAFVCSLIYWVVPAFGLFMVKTSYWPAIVSAILLSMTLFLRAPVLPQVEVVRDDLSIYWQIFQFALWSIVGLLVGHTLFSARFQADSFDTFHHISLAAKYSHLPISGDIQANISDVTMRTMAPYAYNIWGLLVAMVVKISGFDIGTVYCAGSALLVLLMFISHWWLLGLFVSERKVQISAFAIMILIYITRTLATFTVIFQRTEFNFIMYGPSVQEFCLYAVYIALGIRAIQFRRLSDLCVFCGLCLAIAFFHMEFIFLNTLVIFLLILLSLREQGRFRFRLEHVYLLIVIALMGAAGFAVTSHLALGKIADASNGWNNVFYSLRYGNLPVLQRFYPLLRDLLKFTNSYIWNFFAVWGGLLLIMFPSKEVSGRLFNTAYLIMVLMLLFSYNPISDMVFTPLMTSWPIQRIEIYLRTITFIFAALSISICIFRVGSWAGKYIKNFNRMISFASLVLLVTMLLTRARWLPQMASTIYAATYNQGDYLDITQLANLPELKFLDKYSKGRSVTILMEHPYNYVIPSLSRTYSYFHSHYPPFDATIVKREATWEKCLRGEVNCRTELPKESVMMVRNAVAAKFVKIGYKELYVGEMFTVLEI